MESAGARPCRAWRKEKWPETKKHDLRLRYTLLTHWLNLSKAHPLASVTSPVNSRCLITLPSPSEHCGRTRGDAAALDLGHEVTKQQGAVPSSLELSQGLLLGNDE